MICELSIQITGVTNRVIFAVICYIGFFFFDYVLLPIVSLIVNRTLPDKAKRKETLDWKDLAFVNFNRAVTVFFLYLLLGMSCNDKYFLYDLQSIASGPNVAARQALIFVAFYFPLSIIIYDFGYTIFHRVLHYNWLYPLIHKHHHLQWSPFRGNVDAINVHPFEYLVGEFNHLYTQFVMSLLCQRLFNYTPHALFVLVYIVIVGLLSTLNHTRVDVRIPYVYAVWWHDLHHRYPPCNYGQYTMMWDVIFDWYKDESTQTIVSEKHDVMGDGTIVNESPARTTAVKVAATPASRGRGRSSSASKKGGRSSSKKKKN